jgi:hypothetical protein
VLADNPHRPAASCTLKTVAKGSSILGIRAVGLRLGHTAPEISKAPRSIRRLARFGRSSTALSAVTSSILPRLSELWLADYHIGCRLLRSQDRRKDGKVRHGTTCLLVGSGNCPFRHGLYTGDAFPNSKGTILIGSLNPGLLVCLRMKNAWGDGRRAILASSKNAFRDVQRTGSVRLSPDRQPEWPGIKSGRTSAEQRRDALCFCWSHNSGVAFFPIENNLAFYP